MSDLVDSPVETAPTDIKGLDDILCGGFTRNRLFLVEGVPGSGKTTLALQFLLAGAKAGETVLYVTLSETEEEIRAVAASHGWSLDGVTIRELSPTEADSSPISRTRCSTPRRWSWRRRRGACWMTSSGSNPPARCSTRCPRCGSSPATRCAIAGRFSRSSSSLPTGSARCCCWMT